MMGNLGALAAGTVTAAMCGWCLSTAYLKLRREGRARKGVRAIVADTGSDTLFATPETTGTAQRMLLLMQRESLASRERSHSSVRQSSGLFAPDPDLLRKAGMAGLITPVGVRASRIKVAAGTAAIFGLTGAVFTTELAIVGIVVGVVAGCFLPTWALRQEVRTRSQGVERHLSEMIEVVMLGLRSGLSLDRALSLYPRYFDTPFSKSVARTVEQWKTGLVPREEALRDLARQYDSDLLGRVMEDAVRSLRFGNPLAEALESSASEARETHRARMEERIAKAPVKMMMPVGGLILPAMMLLILGPVLLQLVTGL